jgi:hypothetical protein
MLADHFDNVRRLEGIIRTLDAEKPRPVDNAAPAPAAVGLAFQPGRNALNPLI